MLNETTLSGSSQILHVNLHGYSGDLHYGTSQFPIVPLSQIVCGGKVLELSKILTVRFRQDNGYWVCESTSPKISVLGESLRDALNAYKEDFCVLWEEIGLASPKDLAVDAKKLRSELRALVLYGA